MSYTADEVMQYVENEDVKFIRLAFCDIFGRQKNISIMPYELRRAFEDGIAFDASAIRGFGGEVFSDLFLIPDPNTLSVLPWRPEQGRVVRMYCSVHTPDGRIFPCDTRSIYLKALKEHRVKEAGLKLVLKPRFRLFKTDEKGERTASPIDKAGCFDIAPLDGGENVRRQICLTLERMGIYPKSSFHTEVQGQHEIDFECRDISRAADDIMSFITVVKTSASANGMYADISAVRESCGINGGLGLEVTSLNSRCRELIQYAYKGITEHIGEMMPFFDPEDNRHGRTFTDHEEDTLSIHLPELDTNPYLLFALLIYAAAEGIKKDDTQSSAFIQRNIPESIINAYRTEDDTLISL